MELPKNVTQIGESDKNCKIYVEDYVVSYIKQMNQLARNKDLAVALYGVRKQENDITYIFIYGACKLDFIQREIKHLSQAQCQEIERMRRKHFQEQEFQGYRLLNGEMVDGFHICEQNICRYIEGFAQFYEKNECMLSFMLNSRTEEVAPETVNQEKYEAVKRRREERREEAFLPEKNRNTKEKKKEVAEDITLMSVSGQGLWKMRVATAAVFSVLCIAGLVLLWDEEKSEDLQVAARQVIEGLTEQKLPDMEDASATEVQTGTLIVDGGLAEVVQEENTGATLPHLATPAAEITPEPAATPVPTSAPTPTPVPTASSVPVPVSYTIQLGDTLIGISVNRYGSDSRVKEICALNDISDPDDVKVGQVILLPVP